MPFWRRPKLEDLIVDLRMYVKEIDRTKENYQRRSEELYRKARKAAMEGNEHRAKAYLRQHLQCDKTAYALDMFVINMEQLIFDLRNAKGVEAIGMCLGKISKCLDKLKVLRPRGITSVVSKVNKQMEKLGLSMESIFDALKDYEPFRIEPLSEDEVDQAYERLLSEIAVEVPKVPEVEAKIAELERKREELVGKSSEKKE